MKRPPAAAVQRWLVVAAVQRWLSAATAKRWLLAATAKCWLLVATIVGLSAGCESKPKLTMTAEAIISAVRDYADRGCACETDKECFREVRDDWDAGKRELVKNANLLTGADRDAYVEERKRFGLCGDAAGLTVWDNV
jgi:hypothetical protein